MKIEDDILQENNENSDQENEKPIENREEEIKKAKVAEKEKNLTEILGEKESEENKRTDYQQVETTTDDDNDEFELCVLFHLFLFFPSFHMIE